jgi:Mrp family chromosome partitioning ATPase
VISQEDAKHYNEQLFKIREELFRAEAELAEHQATLDAMTNTVPTTNSSLAVQPSNAPPDVVDEYKRICNQLETQEKYEQDLLAQRMKPENAFVQLARKRIEETVKRKRQLEQDHPQLTTTTINSQGRLVETPSISHIALMNETTRIRALHAKINTLNRQLDKVTQQTASAEEMEATIRDLESKRNLQQKSLESLSEGLDRALFDQQLSSGKASNITPLQSPTPPSKEYTKAFKILRAVLLISLVGGIAFAFIFELVLDRSFKRPFEVEMRLGLPLFLTIPQTNLNGNHRRLGAIMQNVRLLPWKSPDEKNGSPAPVPAEDPDPLPLKAVQRLQPFFEALRDRLIMFFEMKNMTHKPKLVAVTSCGRGAGVTTVASGLAASLSETGDGNVLLVDMNIEGGAAHFFHRGELTCDLDDALEMEKRNTALVQDHLYVVTEKSADDKLPRILHKRFSSLIPRLKTSDYDYIIFDMPAVSQISPTPRVARFMDMVMLVVESEKTERDAVKRASDLLAESKANVSVVLNKTRDYVPRVLQQHS